MLKDNLRAWFDQAAPALMDIPFVQAIFSKHITKASYVDFLAEYQHFVYSASSVLALGGAKVSQSHGRVRDWFFEMAYREADHVRFIHSDLKALGASDLADLTRLPSPEMDALLGYNHYVAMNQNPLALLGLMYTMSRLSSQFSLETAQNLRASMGLSDDEGTMFFFAHGHLDEDQEDRITPLLSTVVDPATQNLVLHNAQTNLMLYRRFLGSIRKSLPGR